MIYISPNNSYTLSGDAHSYAIPISFVMSLQISQINTTISIALSIFFIYKIKKYNKIK